MKKCQSLRPHVMSSLWDFFNALVLCHAFWSVKIYNIAIVRIGLFFTRY